MVTVVRAVSLFENGGNFVVNFSTYFSLWLKTIPDSCLGTYSVPSKAAVGFGGHWSGRMFQGIGAVRR